MITFTWQRTLSGSDLAEVERLLAEAVDFDAEAGFSSAAPDAAADGAAWHLLVRMPPRGQRESPHLDRLPDVSVVAYLRLDVIDGAGEVQFVVRPAFRSLGVSTLLMERLCADGGWAEVPDLRILRVWAHGAHPAADRMAQRFGAKVTEGLFKTVRLLGGSARFAADPLDIARPAQSEEPPGSLPMARSHLATLAPADAQVLSHAKSALRLDDVVVAFGTGEHDPAVVVLPSRSAPRDTARALLVQAMLSLRDAGARAAQMYVDPLDESWLAVSRELNFEHDQSDLRYELILGS